MIALGLGLAGALVALGLACRLWPPARGAALLALFGIDADESPTACGDVLGLAGFTAALGMLGAERLGVAVDGMVVADALASGVGLGLAISWLLARAENGRAPGATHEAAPARRTLATELELEPDRGPGDPV